MFFTAMTRANSSVQPETEKEEIKSFTAIHFDNVRHITALARRETKDNAEVNRAYI